MNFPAEIIVMLWFLPVLLQIILPLAVLAVWPIVKMLKMERPPVIEENSSHMPAVVSGGKIAVAGGG